MRGTTINKAKTAMSPAKTVVFGCPLISLRSCSAVFEIYVSADFHVSLDAWVWIFGLYRVADYSDVLVLLRRGAALFSVIANASARGSPRESRAKVFRLTDRFVRDSLASFGLCG